jgi:sugar phosphate permease
LFILEGLPAVVMGALTLKFMTDRPRDARWLSEAERNYLEGVMAEEARAKESLRPSTIGAALRTRNVWLLALGIFAANTGGYALTFWLPTTIKNLSGGSDTSTLVYSGIYYACGLAGVLYAGFLADRTGNRKWTCIAGMWATGVLLGASATHGQSFSMVMVWLFSTGLVTHSWPPPFWALPSATLTASAAAASIGMINICANLAGYFGNHLIGWIKVRGASDSDCLFVLAAWYLLGGTIISFVRVENASRPV